MSKHQMSDEGMAPRIVPACPMPKDWEDLVVQRVVVKEDLSRDLAERLLENLRRVVHYFEQETGHYPKKEGSHFHH
jgi:glutamate decarboxylase